MITLLPFILLGTFLCQSNTKPNNTNKNSLLVQKNAQIEKIRLNYLDPIDLSEYIRIINLNQFQRQKNGR